MWLGWKLLVTKCSPHILHIFMRFESTIWDIDVNLAGSGITNLETTILVLDITLVHYLGNQITQIRDFWSTLRSTLSAETDRASSLCAGALVRACATHHPTLPGHRRTVDSAWARRVCPGQPRSAATAGCCERTAVSYTFTYKRFPDYKIRNLIVLRIKIFLIFRSYLIFSNTKTGFLTRTLQFNPQNASFHPLDNCDSS